MILGVQITDNYSLGNLKNLKFAPIIINLWQIYLKG